MMTAVLRRGSGALVLVAAASIAGVWTVLVSAQASATYLYSLSSFSGPLHDDGARVVVDQQTDETYVIYQSRIRIYSASGMEVFTFGDDLELGQILDVSVDSDGSMLLLSYKDSKSVVTRCNFRGVPTGSFEISHLPAGLEFSANRVVRRGDRLYFVSLSQSRVIITDSTGSYQSHVDLLSSLEGDARKKADGAELFGFAVDSEGSLYFTVPVLFSVYKRTPDGKMTSLGRPGSAPGRFGVVAGIAIDEHGRLFVTDKLKCAVMVFNKDFTFLTEFGYRGSRPESLVAPDDIAVDRRGRVYVAQARKRGVSVFGLTLP